MTDTGRPPHLLIVGGGRELPALARQARTGLRTSVFCRIEVLPRVRDIPANERLFVFRDDTPADEWVAAAELVHRVDPIDFVATYSEKDQDKAAEIGTALELRAPGRDTVRWIHDKFAMRDRLAECGVDETQAILVRSIDEGRAAVERLGLPVICKPVRGVASKGVTRVNSLSELPLALSSVERATAGLDSVDALIEPLHWGEEFSVECFSEDGAHVVAGITRKYSEPVHFVEIGHVVPAALTDRQTALIERTVVAMLDALGVGDGVTHTEIILTDTAVRVIETHLRPAGDEIPYLLAEARQVDLIDALAGQSAGLPAMPAVRAAVEAARDRTSHAAIWYVLPESAGVLAHIGGVEEARSATGVTEVEVLLKVKAPVDPANGSGARVAHVRAVGATAHEAVDRARQAAAAITVVVRATAGDEMEAAHG